CLLRSLHRLCCVLIFIFNSPGSTRLCPLSLHDALPICLCPGGGGRAGDARVARTAGAAAASFHPGSAPGGAAPASAAGPIVRGEDRKSTRLNSSHVKISYAVFCLKKKTKSASNRRPGR